MNKNKFLNTKNLVMTGLFAALLCIFAPFTIPTPIIPISVAPFIISLAGIILGSKLSSLSVFIYILLGLIGLPVFSNHSAGPGILFGATGGFLFGYICMAFLIGLSKKKKYTYNIIFTILGLLLCYLCGFISLRIVTASWNFLAGMIPLFVKDIVVSILAVSLGREISKRIDSVSFSTISSVK